MAIEHTDTLDWSTLKRQLRRARLRDLACKRFGAERHRYALNPPLAERELAIFEADHAVRLPEDYRAFLRDAGNGGAGPYYGIYPLEHAMWHTESPGALARPFPLTEPWRPSDDPMEELPLSFRQGCLALSEHGCGYWSFLVVTGEAAGAVWDDHSVAGLEIEPTAPSFTAWYGAWLSRALRWRD